MVSPAVATTSTAVTTATASTTALGERRRTREDPGRQAQSDQNIGKIAQNGPDGTTIHRHAPLLRFLCNEETGTGIAVGDPVGSGFPATRYPYYTPRARRKVRRFLLSDQAYGKAYRAKVIVFDVGSVHRFSI